MSAISLSGMELNPSAIIRFEQGFDAETPNGKLKAIQKGKPQLVKDRFGKALKSGPATGYLEYPTAAIMNPVEGTIEMWIKAEDWNPTDGKFHVFAETKAKEGWLLLYKYYGGQNINMLSASSPVKQLSAAGIAATTWKTGQWKHIVGTWSKNGVVLYIDGQTIDIYPIPGNLPEKLGKTIRIGDHPWQIERKSSSLIDEVRIYKKALTPEQVLVRYNKGAYGEKVPLNEKTVSLTLNGNPVKNCVTASVFTGGANVSSSKLNARFTMNPYGRNIPVDAKWNATSFSDGYAVTNFLLSAVKPGKYVVTAQIFDNSKKVCEIQKDIIIPDFSWRGNKIGLERKVMKPWTPVETAGTTLKCWNREYRFGKSALPEKITSGNVSLLTAPITLNAEINGKKVKWYKQTFVKKSADDFGAEFAGELFGQSGRQKVEVKVNAQLEYDGLLRIKLSSPDSKIFTSMQLNIPVKAKHAIYRHRYCLTRAGTAGNVPPGDGIVDKSSFLPFSWLGDNDRGLFWCCESDEHWPNGGSRNAYETVRSSGQVAMRINLLKDGQKFASDWNYEFALMATPVKKNPRHNYRYIRAIGDDGRPIGPKSNMKIEWTRPSKLRYFGYPEAVKMTEYKKLIDTRHAQGLRILQYLCLSCQASNIPEFRFYSKYWKMGYIDSMSADVVRYNAVFAAVAPGGKDYSDFITWKTDRFMTESGIDGLYHDNAFAYDSKNIQTPQGYLRDGKLHSTFAIFDSRALYRRITAMTRTHTNNPFNLAHMSGKVMIPILAYHEAYMDGEHFRNRIKDHYPDMLPLDMFRAEYMGRQWGITPYFLPEFTAENAKKVKPTRGLMALLMIHDVRITLAWCNYDVVNKALDALDEFGYADSDFIPYFASIPPAQTDMKDVYISAYKKDDGSVLLIVGNMSREKRSGKIIINLKKLGLGSFCTVDWLDKKKLQVKNASLNLNVPGQGYRMIMLKKVK